MCPKEKKVKMKATTVATDLIGRQVRLTWGMNEEDIKASMKAKNLGDGRLRRYPYPNLNGLGAIRAVYLDKDKELKLVVEVQGEYMEMFLKDVRPEVWPPPIA